MALLKAAEPRRQKISGGYVSTPLLSVFVAWWAYKTARIIRYEDLRTWFACHELVSRRCMVGRGEPRRYTVSELVGLVGGGVKDRLESIRRLERAGLLTWSESRISFASSPDKLPMDDLSGFWSAFERIPNRKRRLPIPRPMLRELAGGLAPVVVATVLGHLVRCLYIFGDEIRCEGSCASGWIAKAFQVDERNVKRARKHLAGIGFFVLKDSEHWHRQKWGGRVSLNLAWSRKPAGGKSIASGELPPRKAVFAPGLPPPESEKELSSRFKNQKPASRGPSGASRAKGFEKEKPPTLLDVKTHDLKSTARLLVLFEQASAKGLVGGSERDRLNFVAAAERALVRGTKNPPGLFIALVRRKLWNNITQGDEDSANERLKRYFYGDMRRREPEEPDRPAAVKRVPISDDAKLVSAVQIVAERHRLRGDPFHLLKRERPDWTLERWNQAVGELESARLLQARLNAGIAI